MANNSIQDELATLHELLAKKLKERLLDTEDPPSSAELNVIRQFLKDNDITAALVEDSPLADLVRELPEDLLRKAMDGAVN